LKGLLYELDLSPERSHDLTLLSERLETKASWIAELAEQFSRLDPFSVNARYPDSQPIGIEEACQAVIDAYDVILAFDKKRVYFARGSVSRKALLQWRERS